MGILDRHVERHLAGVVSGALDTATAFEVGFDKFKRIGRYYTESDAQIDAEIHRESQTLIKEGIEKGTLNLEKDAALIDLYLKYNPVADNEHYSVVPRPDGSFRLGKVGKE